MSGTAITGSILLSAYLARAAYMIWAYYKCQCPNHVSERLTEQLARQKQQQRQQAQLTALRAAVAATTSVTSTTSPSPSAILARDLKDL